MPGIVDRRSKFYALDRELLFSLYLRLGSYDKVSKRLEIEGLINPGTGQPFTRSAICVAVKKSFGWEQYFARRGADPSMPQEPTEAEFEEAARIIAERLPIQRELVKRAAEYKVEREKLQNEEMALKSEYRPA